MEYRKLLIYEPAAQYARGDSEDGEDSSGPRAIHGQIYKLRIIIAELVAITGLRGIENMLIEGENGLWRFISDDQMDRGSRVVWRAVQGRGGGSGGNGGRGGGDPVSG